VAGSYRGQRTVRTDAVRDARRRVVDDRCYGRTGVRCADLSRAGTSSNPAWETLSQDVSITASGVASLLKGTAMTGNLTWTPAPSTARVLQMGSPTSDVNPGTGLQILAASAYSSASTNTAGAQLYLSAGNSQNGTSGAAIQLFGGHNTAGTTSTTWYSDSTILDTVAGTSGIEFSLTGTPAILPWTTNVGTLGTTGNYWATSTRRITCSRVRPLTPC